MRYTNKLNCREFSILFFHQDPVLDSEDDTQNTMSTANTLMPDDKKEIKRGPGLGGFMAVLSSTFKTTVEKVQDDSDSDSTATFGSEQWPRDEMGDIADHPKHTQLMTRMFILLSHMDDPEIIYYILDILKACPTSYGTTLYIQVYISNGIAFISL